MIDQSVKFVPRGMLAEFVGEAQCQRSSGLGERTVAVYKSRIASLKSPMERHASYCLDRVSMVLQHVAIVFT